MAYFAGLFDAEGYVCLNTKGAFTIAIEMANEEIPNLFQTQFKGSIYQRKRDKRKKCWTWKINSISTEALYFINFIEPFSILKKHQLVTLRDYLDKPINYRKITRSITCSTIKDFKKPSPISPHDIFPRIQKPIEPHFFEWLAGFIDGDGNFVCNEYIDNRNKKKYFAHQLSAANTFPEAISYINDRVPGCITTLKRSLNPVFKWACKRDAEEFVCSKIFQFLQIKKNQCGLFMQFLKFCRKKNEVVYFPEDKDKMCDIIKQIKHLNSL